jgi:hypothetical protein
MSGTGITSCANTLRSPTIDLAVRARQNTRVRRGSDHPRQWWRRRGSHRGCRAPVGSAAKTFLFCQWGKSGRASCAVTRFQRRIDVTVAVSTWYCACIVK